MYALHIYYHYVPALMYMYDMIRQRNNFPRACRHGLLSKYNVINIVTTSLNLKHLVTWLKLTELTCICYFDKIEAF
jgi:hypothetical protein